MAGFLNKICRKENNIAILSIYFIKFVFMKNK